MEQPLTGGKVLFKTDDIKVFDVRRARRMQQPVGFVDPIG